MSFSNDLSKFLKNKGVNEFGFAKLDNDYAISFYIAIPSDIVKKFSTGVSLEILKEIDNKLNQITLEVVEFLESNNYKAEISDNDLIATKAGLGWIGKSGFLITKKYGSAIRLKSILTDASLEYTQPIINSSCGSMCRFCSSSCDKINGIMWNDNLAISNLKECDDFCGKCIFICPHTQRYLKKG